MSDQTASRHLVLVGLMGAGKTTVGRRCARTLDRPFVDTDDVVVAIAGRPVAEIFEHDGEAVFRQLERDAVRDVSASPEPLVIACGGGVVLDADSRGALRANGVVVWLQAPTAALAARVGSGAHRPLLRGGTNVETLDRLAHLRQHAYEGAAHLTVDTDGHTVDEVARIVVEEYRSWIA